MKTLLMVFVILFIDKDLYAEDRVDLSPLKKKFWSAKDKNFTVVQNRSFKKEKRFSGSILAGPAINDPYSSGSYVSLTGSYFFRENFGIESQFGTTKLSPNQMTREFSQRYATVPNHNRSLFNIEISSVFSPIYAKMSLLEKKILYFDMSFLFGAGLFQYEQQTSDGGLSKYTPHVHFTVSQQFYLSSKWALRLDLKNQWSSQEKVEYQVSSQGPTGLGRQTEQNTYLLIGVTFMK